MARTLSSEKKWGFFGCETNPCFLKTSRFPCALLYSQRDVAFRAESSTVPSKIQAFVPGNLIVVSMSVPLDYSEEEV